MPTPVMGPEPKNSLINNKLRCSSPATTQGYDTEEPVGRLWCNQNATGGEAPRRSKIHLYAGVEGSPRRRTEGARISELEVGR